MHGTPGPLPALPPAPAGRRKRGGRTTSTSPPQQGEGLTDPAPPRPLLPSQTRGKFGLGAKMALIWSKMTTGLPFLIRSGRPRQSFISNYVLDIDIHKWVVPRLCWLRCAGWAVPPQLTSTSG